MLTHVLARAKAIQGVDQVVITTTTRPADDALVNLCRGAGVRWTRGQVPLPGDPKRNDVLAGYVVAAETTGAEIIIRLTSDCPLLDPAVAGAVLAAFRTAPSCAYASNVHPPSLYDGCDIEVISRGALFTAARDAARDEREHVTTHLWRRPETYPQVNVTAPAGEETGAAWKLSVDTAADLKRVRRVWEALPHAIRREGAPLTWRSVVAAYRKVYPSTAEVRAARLYGTRAETREHRAAYVAGIAAGARAETATLCPYSTADAPALAAAWAFGWEDVAVLGRAELAE